MPGLVHCPLQAERMLLLGGPPVMAAFISWPMGMPVETANAHLPMPSGTSGAPGSLQASSQGVGALGPHDVRKLHCCCFGARLAGSHRTLQTIAVDLFRFFILR